MFSCARALSRKTFKIIALHLSSLLVSNFLRGIAADMAPAGIDIGARTLEELALSVMTEIVMRRRAGSGEHMRDRLMCKGEKAPESSRSGATLTCLSP